MLRTLLAELRASNAASTGRLVSLRNVGQRSLTSSSRSGRCRPLAARSSCAGSGTRVAPCVLPSSVGACVQARRVRSSPSGLMRRRRRDSASEEGADADLGAAGSVSHRTSRLDVSARKSAPIGMGRDASDEEGEEREEDAGDHEDGSDDDEEDDENIFQAGRHSLGTLSLPEELQRNIARLLNGMCVPRAPSCSRLSQVAGCSRSTAADTATAGASGS